MGDGHTDEEFQTLARPPGIPVPREACGVRPVYRRYRQDRYRQDFKVTKAVASIKAPPSSSILHPLSGLPPAPLTMDISAKA